MSQYDLQLAVSSEVLSVFHAKSENTRPQRPRAHAPTALCVRLRRLGAHLWHPARATPATRGPMAGAARRAWRVSTSHRRAVPRALNVVPGHTRQPVALCHQLRAFHAKSENTRPQGHTIREQRMHQSHALAHAHAPPPPGRHRARSRTGRDPTVTMRIAIGSLPRPGPRKSPFPSLLLIQSLAMTQ